MTVSSTTSICDSYHSQGIRRPLASTRSMLICRKLVSVLLLALIPTASALTLAACPQGMAEMATPHSHMAMMGVVSPQLRFASSQINSCCDVLPAQSATAPERALLSDEVATPLAASTLPVQISQNKNRVSRYHENRGASPPVRALLCVFLI